MLRYIVLLVAISYAFAQLHSVCHSNHQQLTEEQVVRQLADLCDRNSNSFIAETEIVVCFGEILDISFPLPETMILAMDYNTLINLASLFGFSIDKQNFIEKWHASFHDNHDFIEATFDVFDDNRNGVWSISEVDDILNHLLDTVDNGDGLISKEEFITFYTDLYVVC